MRALSENPDLVRVFGLDPVRLAQYAFVIGSAVVVPGAIFTFARRQLAPYKRVRRIEFVTELPKTISGKIRRVQLRQREAEQRAAGTRADGEFFEEDFPSLRSGEGT